MRRVFVAGLLLVICVGAGVHIVATRRLANSSGLDATYRPQGAPSGPAAVRVRDELLTTETVLRRARDLGATDLAVEWRGVLVAPRTATYRFASPASGELTIQIDRAVVGGTAMPSGGPAVRLSRGTHPVVVTYHSSGDLRLDLMWAESDGPFERIPPLLLMPSSDDERIGARILLTRSRLLIPLAASISLAALMSWSLVRAWRRLVVPADTIGQRLPPSMRALAAGAAVLYATGMWWGVPGYASWAPDELSPSEVWAGASGHLAAAWATIYPPVHFLLLALVLLPFRLAEAAGLLAGDSLDAIAAMVLVMRGVSIAMAVGTILLAYRTASEMAGTRAGVIAAAIFSVVLPLTFYAKTANLDVPYTFWVAAALFFYARIYRSGAPRDFYLFAATGTVAVCTKDQAYGFWLLPALLMAGGALMPAALRPQRSTPTPRVLAGMCLVVVGVVAVAFNLPMNAAGMTEHFRLITGPASQNYRMYPGTLAGQAQLGVATIRELGHVMSWPLALLSVGGIAGALAARRREVVYFLLPAVSYYVSFIAVVGYVYDRFLLGVALVVAIAAAGPLERWTRTSAGFNGRRGLLYGVLLLALSRCMSLDWLMVNDARYAVERWVRSPALATRTIAAVGWREYLPRTAMIPWTPLPADLDALERLQPDIVILNAAFSGRAEPGSRAAAFHASLRAGEAGYRRVATIRASTRRLPLGLERRFRDPLEDPFSNLSKVNPPIDIYLRHDR